MSKEQIQVRYGSVLVDWHSSETAPTDGQPVWVSDGDRAWVVMAWEDGTLSRADLVKYWTRDWPIMPPVPNEKIDTSDIPEVTEEQFKKARLYLPYPATVTPELTEVLGMMVFQLSPIAHLHRDSGEDIPRKAEAEQAFVLHWLIKLTLIHGPDWRKFAGEYIQSMIDKVKASKESGNG